jgi:hypothetical protein
MRVYIASLLCRMQQYIVQTDSAGRSRVVWGAGSDKYTTGTYAGIFLARREQTCFRA